MMPSEMHWNIRRQAFLLAPHGHAGMNFMAARQFHRFRSVFWIPLIGTQCSGVIGNNEIDYHQAIIEFIHESLRHGDVEDYRP